MFGGCFVKKNALWLNKFIALKKVDFQRITYSTTPYFYPGFKNSRYEYEEIISCLRRICDVRGDILAAVVTKGVRPVCNGLDAGVPTYG